MIIIIFFFAWLKIQNTTTTTNNKNSLNNKPTRFLFCQHFYYYTFNCPLQDTFFLPRNISESLDESFLINVGL